MQEEVGETVRSDSGRETSAESQIQGNNHRGNTIFNVAGIFCASNPKNPSYNDSTKSPNSPLDETFLGLPHHH